MKKILFVLPFSPYPLSSGGAQAIFNGIDVVKNDLDVYITFEASKCELDNLSILSSLYEGKVNVLPYIIPTSDCTKLSNRQILYRFFFKIEKKLRKLAGYDFTPIRIPHRSWLGEELFPQKIGFAKYVRDIIDEYKIDIVQCEMLCNVTIGLMLPNTVRKIFVHHELGWVIHELELAKQDGDAFEQRMFLEHYKRCEIGLLNAYDDVITLSSIDTDKLIQAGVKANIHTSFAVVNTLQNKLISNCSGKVLSFVGPDCNLPNIEGIKWFLSNVWGRLRQADSSYKLRIIGRWSPEHISEILDGQENVKYLGFVDDLASTLKDTIMIVPITIGSGIRMKILEAASLGIPIVTTSVGVEGIPVEDGVHCLVADTPDSFCESILKLQNENLQKRLSDNAYKLITDHFTLERFRMNRLNIYQNYQY